MVKKKPSRYDIDKQKWRIYDYYPTCKLNEQYCKECGHPGHFSHTLVAKEKKAMISQIDGELSLHYLVRVMLNHAHFVEDVDVGRHVECYAGEYWIDSRQCVTSVRLDPAKIPEWKYNFD